MFEGKQELEKVKEDSNLVKSLLGEGEEGIQREHYKTQIEIKQYLKQFNLIKRIKIFKLNQYEKIFQTQTNTINNETNKVD